MKCIQNLNTGEIRRVTDKEAKRLKASGQVMTNNSPWVYAPKKFWKATRS